MLALDISCKDHAILWIFKKNVMLQTTLTYRQSIYAVWQIRYFKYLIIGDILCAFDQNIKQVFTSNKSTAVYIYN